MAPLKHNVVFALGLALAQPGLAAANTLSFDDKPVSFSHAAESKPAPAAKPAKKAKAKPKAVPAAEAQPVSSTVSAAPVSPAAQPSAASPQPAAPSSPAAALVAALPFKLEGQLFVRYDRQGDQALGYGAPGVGPKAIMGQSLGNTATANKGAVDTLYVRRAEFKLTADPLPWAKLVLGWDLAENKLKDAGLEAKIGDAGRLQLGQFRQRFGIEPQLSSTKILFPERAIMYGGLHPFANGPSALVKERAMGLHGDWKPRYSWLGLELGATLANNTVEDQAAGQSKPGSTGAFPASISDHGPSYDLRAAVDTAKIPGLKKLSFGSSWMHDSQNTLPVVDDPSEERYEEALGLDASLESGPLQMVAEWVGSQRLEGGSPGVWKGMDRRREGWYASACLDLLHPILGADAPDLALLLRDEAFVNVGAAGAPTKFGAWTGGVRYKNGKNFQSSFTCTVYDIDGDTGAMGGSELWVFQQMLTF
jgi:hypothetical protein